MIKETVVAYLILTGSWYSTASLRKEGTWAITKGVMKNGHKFVDNNRTSATRLFPIGSRLCVVNLANNKRTYVTNTDWISKKYARTRIDLSSRAFAEIADLKQGIIQVKVYKIRSGNAKQNLNRRSTNQGS